MKQTFIKVTALLAVVIALSGCGFNPWVYYSIVAVSCQKHKGTDMESTRSAPRPEDGRLYLYDLVCKDGTRVSYSWKGFSLWKEDLLRNVEFDWDKVPFIRFFTRE